MKLDICNWRVEQYCENDLHAIDVFSPRNHDDIIFVLNVIIQKFNAKVEKTSIGPYYTMTYLSIQNIPVAFIADDAEGYPISITCKDKHALPLMDTIATVLKPELCPSN